MIVKKKFGEAPAGVPEGFLRRVLFEPLAWVDQETPDGRTLAASGMKDPYLPATIKFMEVDSEGGHLGSAAVGRLDEVTLHEDGRVTGVGFIEDTALGARTVQALNNRTVKGNSVDLRDTKFAVKFPDFEDYAETADGWMSIPKVRMRFDEWAIGATTILGTPAFGHASAVLDDGEEITASFGTFYIEHEFDVVGDRELTAASAAKRTLPSWDAFHRPEPEAPQKIIVGAPDEHGICEVYGHLGIWDTCHTGFVDKCVRIPRSSNAYSSFNKPGVLTDRGQISTGPMALYGGHPEGPLDPREVAKAYGDIANAWCDVRVADGKFGPWVCGLTRPGVAEEKIYAARASRISGHWKNSDLYAIVSVSAEGFDVPDIQFSQEGDDYELAASFSIACPCEDSELGLKIPTAVFAVLFDDEGDE